MNPSRHCGSGGDRRVVHSLLLAASNLLRARRSIWPVLLAVSSLLFALVVALLNTVPARSAAAPVEVSAARTPAPPVFKLSQATRLAQLNTPTSQPGYPPPPAPPTTQPGYPAPLQTDPTSQPGYPAPQASPTSPPGYPVPQESPSPLPEFSPTPFPEGYQTPTVALIPLGTVTMIFPSPTATATSTGTPVSSPVVGAVSPEQRELARFGLFTMVGILWILLAGWLYILLRQFNF